MNKNLPKISLILFLLTVCLFFCSSTSAQRLVPQGKFNVNIAAKVGQYYLNLSGWISLYTSIVLTSEGVFLRSTVADANGIFHISQVLIKEGFSKFCLEAIDFKRIGTSYTCFEIPPAKGSVNMHDIFLPPTLGLARTEIGENDETTAFGYTMPGARVKLYLSNGKILETIADSTGYYEFKVGKLRAGEYKLYARAEYNGVESLKPTKTLGLKSLSWWQMLLIFFKDLWEKLIRFITSIGLGPLWIALPIIILIIILILKLWPERFTFIYNSKLLAWLPRKKKKKLHHAWWMGY